jgi:indoleamine 2,3-dioxygenase
MHVTGQGPAQLSAHRVAALHQLACAATGTSSLACLQAPYNECVAELEKFRSQHKAFAFNYIAKHSKRDGETGTGGSDFMPALQGYRDATSQHLIS